MKMANLQKSMQANKSSQNMLADGQKASQESLPEDQKDTEENEPLLDSMVDPEQELTEEQRRIMNRAWYIVDDDSTFKHVWDIFMGPLVTLSVFSTFFM